MKLYCACSLKNSTEELYRQLWECNSVEEIYNIPQFTVFDSFEETHKDIAKHKRLIYDYYDMNSNHIKRKYIIKALEGNSIVPLVLIYEVEF